MPSVPEGEVQHNSVARQVFPEATATTNVSESKAKVVEDILAASADDNREPRHEEERVATPPITQEKCYRGERVCARPSSYSGGG